MVECTHLCGRVGLRAPPGPHQRTHQGLERPPVSPEHAQQRRVRRFASLQR